ncbi:hypothetical protein V8F20_006693 [Naviculisporaceae sp. PSN 640]
MEKFTKWRDKATGVAPFTPITTPSSVLFSVVHTFIFLIRLPLFLAFTTFYLLILHPLPLPSVLRKLFLWGILAIPGIWWVDLQIDGVKRGSLSQQPPQRTPHPGSVIAANFTSPIDALYLAAIFDPIFTISYPHNRVVRRIGLLRAILQALSLEQFAPSPGEAKTTSIAELLAENPSRVIVVFPECTTTNGKGIMPLSPSLLSVPADNAIFPVSLRYTPPDVTTPVVGGGLKLWVSFLWKLLSRPTHCIRVRIAERMYNTSLAVTNGVEHGGTERDLTRKEIDLLDGVSNALARLGRSKRVCFSLEDKKDFVKAWTKK